MTTNGNGTRNGRKLKLINLKAASKVKDARKGSKIATLINVLGRDGGATLQDVAKSLSRKGSKVTPSYAKAWINYDLHRLHGFGVRSEYDGNKVRCFLVRPTA